VEIATSIVWQYDGKKCGEYLWDLVEQLLKWEISLLLPIPFQEILADFLRKSQLHLVFPRAYDLFFPGRPLHHFRRILYPIFERNDSIPHLRDTRRKPIVLSFFQKRCLRILPGSSNNHNPKKATDLR